MSWYRYNRRLYGMGPQYDDYKELNKILIRHRRRYKRNWMRSDYMAYWVKVKKGIEMRVGWRCMQPTAHHKGERLLLWRPDGSVIATANIAYPYERLRFNYYFPHRDKWQMWWWHSGLILSPTGKDYENGFVIYPRFDTDGNRRRVARARYIEFDKNGELVSKLKFMSFKEYKKKKIREANVRAKPRKRGWYWTRRARNIFRDQSKCISNTPYNARSQDDWSKYQCQAARARWETQGPQAYRCGCVTSRKMYKRGFNKTVKQILEEPNATVRSAWIQIYGIQKFFMDAGSKVINKRTHSANGHTQYYDLLRLEAGNDDNGILRHLTAVKMTCPTTGTVYINAVPDGITTVTNAMNWIYDVGDYFGTIGKQT